MATFRSQGNDMIKPVLKYIQVHTGQTCEDFSPEITDNFWCTFDFGVGPNNEEGHHDYSVQVGTPRAFDHAIQNQGPMWGRHYIIVNEYDAALIKSVIEQKIEECARETWEETYQILSRYFKWQYEDYK